MEAARSFVILVIELSPGMKFGIDHLDPADFLGRMDPRWYSPAVVHDRAGSVLV
ncbi:hypothetical protein SDC9_186006 [bioreactor metagenome]|uniref:Uncharacterized protein n=1 Tax=bioreactor metagenome TaxID=1076179 RepID=A0A645HJA4_9ZZZZ